jgi:hypothetical protein
MNSFAEGDLPPFPKLTPRKKNDGHQRDDENERDEFQSLSKSWSSVLALKNDNNHHKWSLIQSLFFFTLRNPRSVASYISHGPTLRRSCLPAMKLSDHSLLVPLAPA